MARTSHLPNLALVVAWVTSRLVTKELRKVLEADPPRISFLSGREISPTDSEPHGCSVSWSATPPAGLSDLGNRIVASMQQIAFRDSGQSR
jgi:hypothetical protein